MFRAEQLSGDVGQSLVAVVASDHVIKRSGPHLAALARRVDDRRAVALIEPMVPVRSSCR